MGKVSEGLKKKIEGLEASIERDRDRLKILLRLAESAKDGILVPPKGCVVAKVVDWNVSSSEFRDRVPDNPTYVVVPKKMGNIIRGYVSSKGIELTGSGWTMFSPDYVGEDTEEETLLRYYRPNNGKKKPHPKLYKKIKG